jgi:hypothetical protein
MSDTFNNDHSHISHMFDKHYGGDHEDVNVKSYFRKDGHHVDSHFRSHPDGDPFNNWSFPGNMNPHTGEVASGDPLHYMHHPVSNFDTIICHDNPLSKASSFVMPQFSFV